MIGFGAEVCGEFGRATSYEWLETDGLGGYASSTIVGANTRRYHGLLMAAMRPPERRMLLLSKLEETLAVRETEYDLSCNQYPGRVYPEGHRYLRAFRLDPFPTFLYEIDGGVPTRLEKQVAMCRGTRGVIVRYRVLSAPGTVSLVVRPLLACREDHHLMQENPSLNTRVNLSGARDVLAMTLYEGCPTLHIGFAGAYFEEWGDWYRRFEYAQEQARGLDFREDLYSPGFFTRTMEAGETCYLIASTEPPGERELSGMLELEQRRRRAHLRHGWEGASEDLATLVRGADAFLVSREPGRGDRPAEGMIAGYHWFGEWGRDTMISLPGLTLVTRRFEAARAILQSYASLLSEGMIPNQIPPPGETPAYNTVDATLWMFWAARKYLEYTGDREFIERELLPAFREVITWHVRGTRYGIKADSDGLLRAGEPGTQLTWMDAKVGDWVVTPRHGKPVEVNALWHHALCFVEELEAEHDGPPAAEVAAAFRQRFWNATTGYLNDVVDGETREDASLRPNQIIAVSLPSPLLGADQARQVVEVVQRELLTPYGLRTLSPKDPRYRGRYEGDVRSRDGAYHQGTVWPWLFGPFVSAYLRVAEDRAAAQETARSWVQPLYDHLREAGLGQISEIFEGDPPHRPCGCIAQAWSVAEVLRVIVEELGGMDMAQAEGVELQEMQGKGPGAGGQGPGTAEGQGSDGAD